MGALGRGPTGWSMSASGLAAVCGRAAGEASICSLSEVGGLAGSTTSTLIIVKEEVYVYCKVSRALIACFLWGLTPIVNDVLTVRTVRIDS